VSRRAPRRGNAGAFLASAAGVGVLLAVAGGSHGRGIAASLDSLRATPADGRSAHGGEALADRLAAHLYGWTGAQRGCLNSLWAGESGFSNTADTRKTGLDRPGASVFAYGIPQARGHGAWTGGMKAPYPPAFGAANPPSLGGTSDARTQIRWGLGYIKRTYTKPCGALAFKQAHGNQGY
jgi:hypothetical protein